MAMVTCDECGYLFSDRRPRGCPKCSPKETPVTPASILAKWFAEDKAVKIFVLSAGLIIAGFWCYHLMRPRTWAEINNIGPNNRYYKGLLEECRLQAHIDTAENGSPFYVYAEAKTATQATLHFRRPKSGRTWTTTYFCE